MRLLQQRVHGAGRRPESKAWRTSRAKAVATNAAGSAVDIAMRAMLRKHGLEDKRDYTSSRHRSRRCGPCWPKRRPIWCRPRCHSRLIRS